jgi:hypothetical protein
MSIKASVLKNYKETKKLYLWKRQTPNIKVDDLPQSKDKQILSLYFVFVNTISILLINLNHYKKMKKVYLWQMASERQFGVFFSRDYN